jgi:hypothetical protein
LDETFYPGTFVGRWMPPVAGTMDRDAVRALDQVEHRLSVFDRQLGIADWATYTGRGDERATVRLQSVRATFLRSAEVGRLARQLSTPLGSPLLDRRAELLRRARLDADVEQSPEIVRLRGRLQAAIVRYRPNWHGKRVGRAVVYDALRRSRDRSERERAWRAEAPLHDDLESPLRRLIGLRNDRARAAGYRTFADLRLKFEGVSAPRLRGLARSAGSPLRRIARDLHAEHAERTGDRQWAPWDLRFALENRAPLPQKPFPGSRMVPIVRRALSAWGFPPGRLLFPVVRTDQPFGGLTVAPRIPTDIRILVHPKGGWEYYAVLFHEYGHAVHFRSVDQPTHLLRNPDLGYAGFAEGLAGVFEQVGSDPAWLAKMPGLDRAAVEEFARWRARAAVIDVAGHALAFDTELRLYEAPDRDPRSEVHALALRWFGYDEYEVRSWADPFLVTHPVYQQSYLISPLFRAQVVAAMARATSGPFWPNRRAAPWLTESFFAAGARYDWAAHLADVTGHPLSATDFVAAATRSN